MKCIILKSLSKCKLEKCVVRKYSAPLKSQFIGKLGPPVCNPISFSVNASENKHHEDQGTQQAGQRWNRGKV